MPKAKESKDKSRLPDKAAPPPPSFRIVEIEETEAGRAERLARAETFKALGDPIRLMICIALASVAPDALTAGAVCAAVTDDKKITAKISHHLKELRRAGLITMRKDGKHVFCSLNAGGVAALSASLNEWLEWSHLAAIDGVTENTTETATRRETEGTENDDDTASKNDDEYLAHAA